MARNRQPVLKKCRNLGLEPSILGVNKKSNRNIRPNANRKLTDYGTQLREKQKARRIYGVLEGQFRHYYEKADHMKGITGENLLMLLEMRLDNVVYRLGFAKTRAGARQLVSHRHITVNGELVNIPSYLLKAGDVVAVREKSKSLEVIADSLASKANYEWLQFNDETKQGTFVSAPERIQIPEDIKEQLIVELYSK